MISVDTVSPVAAHEHDLLSILFDSMPVGVAVYDCNFVLRSFNPTWAGYVERYARCERSRIVAGANLYDLAPGIENATMPLFTRALAGETVRREGLRLKSRGVVSYWDVVLCPLFENGKVVNIVEVAADATSRILAYQTLEQRVEERTREIERRREVAESLGEMLALLNSSQTLMEILQPLVAQARQLLGADCAAIFDLHAGQGLLTVQAFDGAPDELLAGYTLPVGVGAVGVAVLKREPVLIADTRTVLPGILAEHNSEEERHLREMIKAMVRHYRTAFAMPLIVRGEIYGGIALYYEKTRRFADEDVKLADMFAHQAGLAIENARLRQQIEEAAVAAERNRIARDLHDSVTQTLFSASLIAEVLPRLWERDPGEAAGRAQEMRQLTRGALAEMRMLLLELRPATLADVPLGDLLKQLAEASGGRSRIPVAVSITGECPSLPRAVHNALYRIAQEALNNIAKHSDATQAGVSLRYDAHGTELTVSDDGRGFDPATVGGEHLGLDIMHERAREIGAAFSVESEPANGTRVLVIWAPGVRGANGGA